MTTATNTVSQDVDPAHFQGRNLVTQAFRPAAEALKAADDLAHRLAGNENVKPDDISRISRAAAWGEGRLLLEVERHREVILHLRHAARLEDGVKRRDAADAKIAAIHARLAEARAQAQRELAALGPEHTAATHLVSMGERARQRLRDDLLPEPARQEIQAMLEPLASIMTTTRSIEAMVHALERPIEPDAEIMRAGGTREAREEHKAKILALNVQRVHDLQGAKRRLAQLQAEARVYVDRREALMSTYVGPA